MRTILLFFVFSFLFFLQSSAQDQKASTHSIQLAFGRSFHGSGDLRGIIFDVSHAYQFKKRLDLTTGIASTIHWGHDFHSGPSGDDRSLRYTTAGLQLSSVVHFAPLATNQHNLSIGGGGLARFQSDSYPGGGYSYTNNPSTYPEPFYVLYNRDTKQNIFTVGYTFGLQYLYSPNKFRTGIKAMFQNDTNGDAISYVSLIVGRRL